MEFKTKKLSPFGLLIEPQQKDQDVQSLDVEKLRQLFWKEQLIVLRGFRQFQNPDEFPDYCENWGTISLWPFGKTLELIEQENPEDHIFDNNYVPLHWDGMYRPQVPEFQIFNCVKAPLPGQGGRTVFSNTVLALEHASPETRSLWAKVTGNYKRKMQFYDSETISPVITGHPLRNFPVIRYNEPPTQDHTKDDFLNPPDLEFTGATNDEITKAHQSLKEALYSSDCFYAHEWHDGDIVIADNFTLLHGREKFVSRSPRHLRRVHALSNPPLDNPGLVSHK